MAGPEPGSPAGPCAGAGCSQHRRPRQGAQDVGGALGKPPPPLLQPLSWQAPCRSRSLPTTPLSCVSLLPWGRMVPEPGEAVSGSQPGEHHKAVFPPAKRTSLPRSGSTGGRSVASAWSGSVPNRNSPRGCAKSTGQPSRVYSSSGLIPTQISSNSVHLYLGTTLLIKTLWTGH